MVGKYAAAGPQLIMTEMEHTCFKVISSRRFSSVRLYIAMIFSQSVWFH